MSNVFLAPVFYQEPDEYGCTYDAVDSCTKVFTNWADAVLYASKTVPRYWGYFSNYSLFSYFVRSVELVNGGSLNLVNDFIDTIYEGRF